MDGWETKKGGDRSARPRESKTNRGNGVRVTQKRASGEGSGRVGWLIVLHRGRCWAPWSRRGWPTCCILQGFCKEASSYDLGQNWTIAVHYRPQWSRRFATSHCNKSYCECDVANLYHWGLMSIPFHPFRIRFGYFFWFRDVCLNLTFFGGGCPSREVWPFDPLVR